MLDSDYDLIEDEGISEADWLELPEIERQEIRAAAYEKWASESIGKDWN